MKVLFCNIAWMEYYGGVTEEDQPINAGSWLSKSGEDRECFNFYVDEEERCHGYVYIKATKGKGRQIHLENIEGLSEEDDKAEGVLVIWVAKDPYKNQNNIVGWYKNATVFRNYNFDNEEMPYNIFAKKEDCTLLPANRRHKIVPKAGRGGYSYGMGSSNIWYGREEDDKALKYIKNMVNYIETYDGDNLISPTFIHDAVE